MSHKKTLPIFAIALAVTILASLLPTVATIRAADSDLTSPAAAPQSDDFDSCVLNDTLWTFTDPLSDSQLAANGSQVTISMAAGAEHDLWEGKNQAVVFFLPLLRRTWA